MSTDPGLGTEHVHMRADDGRPGGNANTPPARQPPISLRACGPELAEGRLVTTHVVYPWGTTTHINGKDVCPVHDADWPAPGLRSTGACLVTYMTEGGSRG